MLIPLQPQEAGEAPATSLRAGLIRANACRFADRYHGGMNDLLGAGRFGRVHRCVDRLVRIRRAVKTVPLPATEERRAVLRMEINSLVALDHPHIVRLIEYFVEGGEMLLVMELLEGPSLGDRMREAGPFEEKFAARCARHMLKALFCCHCQGIAHNDVSPENFRFSTKSPEWNLKMVDFGLSERFCEDLSPKSREYVESRVLYVQERDIYAAGTILYEMLSGKPLFERSDRQASLAHATDPTYVPARLSELNVSEGAQGLLRGMLDPTTEHRMDAREALLHPFITKFYDTETDKLTSENGKFTLQRCTEALRKFHGAPRLMRISFLITAHLLTNNNDTISDIHWLFRYLIRDMQRVEERFVRDLLEAKALAVPDDFHTIFSAADVSGKGGLDYVEFVAVAISLEPRIYCQEVMLRAVFRFLDAQETGVLIDDTVRSLFDLPITAEPGIVLEACGTGTAVFATFKDMMTPTGWDASLLGETPASWAEAPDTPVKSESLGHLQLPPRVESGALIQQNLVASLPSDVFAVCQQPQFHSSAMRPFYARQPVSNIVMGIVRGTSRYAKRCASLGIADVLQVGGNENGVFFIMPNPKYHWEPRDAVAPLNRKWRFVAWWIAPDFVEELLSWVREVKKWARADGDVPQGGELAPGSKATVGGPGDFGFSDLTKPKDYLHTYRDLHGGHAALLEGLCDAVGRFTESFVGDALPSTSVSAGFHYPVRPQYSTLHLHLRINSGDVSSSADCRGIDLLQVVNCLRDDPDSFQSDKEILHYQATANLHATVLSAAGAADASIEEVGPTSLVLRPGAGVPSPRRSWEGCPIG